ncbi:ribosome biogenesis GTPase Der [Acidihalobacter yilgarnensis]|uniref:GTPase Der n=1 Tax=Acidihalobacter yilgarnensis TaxID=2819280 RepID=A0A1D8IP33_9GAMM|nr:ribosome biogenesis GTPase Der [Acidihalobacter yilgarnensis]AOU98212.1 ribosome biogenesis GTPase Der [Acidihalobacter yilgarnensis]
MQAILALVGRPNVGKSTLFNRLTRSRDALVANLPGLTRDRKYGLGRLGERDYLVIDTGGLGEETDAIDALMGEQTRAAMREATHLLLMIDGRAGVTAGDEALAEELRAMGKPVVLVVNKIDTTAPTAALAEAYRLGLGEPMLISATRGSGLEALIDLVVPMPPAVPGEVPPADEAGEATSTEAPANTTRPPRSEGTRIAFVGRPNVGKSTLVNRLLGENRVVVFDQPGTTRDTIDVPFERDGRRYVLVDTAGIRRRARVNEMVEKFSIVKALDAINAADVVVLVLDARAGITEQDAHLIGLALDAGAPLVVAINKWDGLSEGDRASVRRGLDLRLTFLDYAERHFISALHGTGVGHLLTAAHRADDSSRRQVSTAELNRLLEGFVTAHQPPLSRGRRIKLRYAHLGGHRPFTIVIHGNQTERLTGEYKRYLANAFRRALKLVGTPVALEFKTGDNPFAGRRNTLTPYQEHKRRRLIQHAKRNDR